jgi:hypothetical protein
MKLDTREKLLTLDLYKLQDYKINYKHTFRSSTYGILSLLYSEYNIKPYELSRVPHNYWKNKDNANEYMEYFLNNIVNVKLLKNIKLELSSYFNKKYMEDVGCYLLYCLYYYKHYNSFFEWLNYLHSEWNLDEKYFNNYIGFDNTKLNSGEEVILYNFLKKDVGLNIKATGTKRKSKYKYYNEIYNEYYIPDFLLKLNDKTHIIEYFGMWQESPISKIFINYYYKTIRKIDYFTRYCENNPEYSFIALFPNDLKNNFRGIKDKLNILIS